MNRAEFAATAAEAFDVAKSIVHQRKRTSTTEFMQRVKRLDILKSLDKSEHWKDWPLSPTTFGQYQRAGDSALHVAHQFATTVYAAVQVAKLNALGMPSDLDTLTESDWRAWIDATILELETTTLELSHWTPAQIMRDADLILRKIKSEFEQGEYGSDGYIELDKNRVRELYGKANGKLCMSETWLRKRLTPIVKIPCCDITHKTLRLCSIEYARLMAAEAKYDDRKRR